MKRNMKTPAKKPSLTTLRKAVFEQTAAGVVIVSVEPAARIAEDAGVYDAGAVLLPFCRIITANPAFAAMMGEMPKTVLGKNLLGFVDERDKDVVADVLSLGVAQILTARHTHADGTPFFAQVQTTPLGELAGGENYVLCTYMDVTDLIQTNESLTEDNERLAGDVKQKTQDLQEFIDEIRVELNARSELEAELWQAEKRYRSLAQNFPNGAVILLDKKLHCILAEGTQAEKLPLHDNGTVRTLAEPLASAAEAAIMQAFEGKSHSFEIALGGEPYLVYSVPITAARKMVDAVMLVCQNITDFKTRQMLEQEREMTALKYGFVTIASHELRTPLAGMMLASGILRRYWDSTSNEDKWESVQDIITGLERMASLLDNILLVGKSDSGKLPFDPTDIDLVFFCRELVREHEKSLGQTHVTRAEYAVETLPFYADPKLLRLIFGNLLSNAYKYSPFNTEVRFAVEATPDAAIITIQDSGIGITPEDLPKLFATFHRGKNVGEIQGSGLGLAIVERAVNMHGGTIEVESTVNVGTTFRVILPYTSPTDATV